MRRLWRLGFQSRIFQPNDVPHAVYQLRWLGVRVIRLDIYSPSFGWRLWLYTRPAAWFGDVFYFHPGPRRWPQ